MLLISKSNFPSPPLGPSRLQLRQLPITCPLQLKPSFAHLDRQLASLSNLLPGHSFLALSLKCSLVLLYNSGSFYLPHSSAFPKTHCQIISSKILIYKVSQLQLKTALDNCKKAICHKNEASLFYTFPGLSVV